MRCYLIIINKMNNFTHVTFMEIHKDIVEYIYKLIHQSNVTDIIKEYNQSYYHILNTTCETINDVCQHEYTMITKKWKYFSMNFRTDSIDTNCIFNIKTMNPVAPLPKNYI